VPLRIAFDLDGVLADMESELVRQAGLLFGEQVIGQAQPEEEPNGSAAPGEADPGAPGGSAGDAATESPLARQVTAPLEALPISRLQITVRQQSRLWRHVESIEGFWETLQETETGIVARLANLAAERRWEVLFLTKRPTCEGETTQVQSQRWLAAKGFPLPSVYVVQGSRGRVAAALGLDFVVDDRPENCLDVVVDSKARAILVWREDETRLPAVARRLGIGVVKSVGECLDILSLIDEMPSERPGVLDRVMRLLGLKDQPQKK
jgi:hypothetical protein